MAAMRKLAWRLEWLDRSVDPLEGLELGRSSVLQGASSHYVDLRLRPWPTQPTSFVARRAPTNS